MTQGFRCASSDLTSLSVRTPETKKVISLAGNPNVGKSTVFNALTGMRQHTGNWPGKTVELAQGHCGELLLVDLPGMYSLTPGSPEEAVSASFLDGGEAEAVIVVCDATCLQRSLVLALQILSRTAKVVVAVFISLSASVKPTYFVRETVPKFLVLVALNS